MYDFKSKNKTEDQENLQLENEVVESNMLYLYYNDNVFYFQVCFANVIKSLTFKWFHWLSFLPHVYLFHYYH